MFDTEYKGIDAVAGYWMKPFELSGGTIKVEPVHILADDERSIAIQHTSATRERKLLDTQLVLVFEVVTGRSTK